MPVCLNVTHEAFNAPAAVSSCVPCPELWELYQQQVDSFATLRKDIFEKVERLRVPVQEFHCLMWEAKTREVEAKDLQVQLEDAELRLSLQQQDVLQALQENEKKQDYQKGAEGRMQQAAALAQPRVEQVRFHPNAAPERLAGFPRPSQAALAKSKASATAPGLKAPVITQQASESVQPVQALEGRVQVAYLPNDISALLKAQLGTLEEQVEKQKNYRITAQSTIDRLKRIQEEEARLLKEALSQQLQRIQQRRHHIQEGSEKVQAQYLRLRFEHGEIEKRLKEDSSALKRSHGMLSEHLQDVASSAVSKKTTVEQQALKAANRTVRASSASQLQARESMELAHDRLGAAKVRGGRLIRELEVDLSSLSDQCKRLAGHRKEELQNLRTTSAKLKQRMRDLEGRAAAAVAEVGSGVFGVAIADWPTFTPTLQALRADLDAFEITLNQERAASMDRENGSDKKSNITVDTAKISMEPTQPRPPPHFSEPFPEFHEGAQTALSAEVNVAAETEVPRIPEEQTEPQQKSESEALQEAEESLAPPPSA